jgi:uncharacterized protein YkwD
MKKLLITSVCTLGLTLLGAFGNYQNSFALQNELGASSSTTNVEQFITENNLDSLPDDNNSLAYAAVKKDTSKNIKAVKTTAEKAKNTAQKSNSKKSKSTKVKGVSTNKQNMVYKNVDLSNCTSKADVVKVLKKNGVKGVTLSNIDDVKGLKNILSCIKTNNKNTTKKTTSTVKPTPTKAPTATTKPTPTKAPTATTEPTPTKAPTATTSSSELSNYADQVLKLVNQERAKAGLPALTTNKTLQSAANKRAQEIVQSFSHTRPNGSSPFTVLKEYGISYQSAGENIAYGQKNPEAVMNAWMNSSGHRANILKNGFGKVGIGVYKANGVLYWTQLFTN